MTELLEYLHARIAVLLAKRFQRFVQRRFVSLK